MDGNFGKIEKIRSSIILKRIFSLLWKNKKLDLIIYNKKLQGKFGLNIDDYKKASKKYKKIEINGKGKEYLLDTNIVIFEGEYLNGKKNGKGKEYYPDNKIKF